MFHSWLLALSLPVLQGMHGASYRPPVHAKPKLHHLPLRTNPAQLCCLHQPECLAHHLVRLRVEGLAALLMQ